MDTASALPFDILIIIDFEATCDENPSDPSRVQVSKDNQEIIEFPWVVLDTKTLSIVHQQQIYVKPQNTPVTSFCTQLTGITKERLENAGTLESALMALDTFIQAYVISWGKTFAFVTHGRWDLAIQLPREARSKRIALPSYFSSFFDVKQEVTKWLYHHPEISVTGSTLRDLSSALNVPLVGKLHCGLDDCLSICNIVVRILQEPKDTFRTPIDMAQAEARFRSEESKIVMLGNLPYTVSEPELMAWFARQSLTPTSLLCILDPDRRPSGNGFAEFANHRDAAAALNLNGNSIMDRSVEVSPSHEKMLEASKPITIPFLNPNGSGLATSGSTSNGPVVRYSYARSKPGDWECVECGYKNFAYRKVCGKCGAASVASQSSGTANSNDVIPISATSEGPMGAAVDGASSSHTHAPHYAILNTRPGDWECTCGFQNFSSRTECLRCGGPSPHGPGYSGADSTSGGGGGYGGGSSGYGSGGGYGHGGHGGHGGGSRPPLTMRPGDWICRNSQCQHHNFASRSVCMRCGSAAPSSSSSSSSSSSYNDRGDGYGHGHSSSSGHHGHHGGFTAPADRPGFRSRPGDWTCSSCYFVNFASRTVCFKCHQGSNPAGGDTRYDRGERESRSERDRSREPDRSRGSNDWDRNVDRDRSERYSVRDRDYYPNYRSSGPSSSSANGSSRYDYGQYNNSSGGSSSNSRGNGGYMY